VNIPPASSIRVQPEVMHRFTAQLGLAAGLAQAHSDLLAELLTGNDLRGVFSHGTQQLATYGRLLRDGVLNSRPQVTVVRETPVSLLVDGDGGLGYFAAHEGTLRLIDKVKISGTGVLVTRNHGHFGAAGLYARMTVAHDLLCFVTSGHQLRLEPGQPVFTAAGGSPMAFSAPTLTEDPLVLDFGAMHDLYEGSPFRDEVAARAPGMVHRAIGMGEVCQAWGGLLAGVPIDPARARRSFAGANQGSMVIAFRIDLFADPVEFKQEMDAYVRAVRTLTPFADGPGPYLPGGIEAERQRLFSVDGIPVGPDHRDRLQQIADELGVRSPWTSQG